MNLKKQVSLVLRKHPGHDEKTHGNWAHGITHDHVKSWVSKIDLTDETQKAWGDHFAHGEKVLRESDIAQNVSFALEDIYKKLGVADAKKQAQKDANSIASDVASDHLNKFSGRLRTPEPYIANENLSESTIDKITASINDLIDSDVTYWSDKLGEK
jgi:hypothetical protein